MRQRSRVLRPGVALVWAALLAVPASAQTGRVGGIVRNQHGEPIDGATVVAENAKASATGVTTTTDDSGRFSIVGLRGGDWTLTASAPGFLASHGVVSVKTAIAQATLPVEFTLARGSASGRLVDMGMSALAKGDLAEAERLLSEAAGVTDATKEVFYYLGEVKFARGDIDGAASEFERAAQLDPGWAKPVFKLALVQLNKRNTAACITILEKVQAVEPDSEEAAQAGALIAQLKK